MFLKFEFYENYRPGRKTHETAFLGAGKQPRVNWPVTDRPDLFGDVKDEASRANRP
ncbi:hypothetical protein PM082_016248 [Marasmius tenuissimus]|nr:hypothetical protein PM082_016248 [Marasmius tenuissimus]